MKQLATILLLTTIFLQTFGSFVIRADYFFNKDFIARVLCINREKPAMHCDGKCYLKKQLKQQEQQEQQVPNAKHEKLDVQPFFLPGQLTFAFARSSDKVQYHYTAAAIPSAFPRSVFHPPAV